MPLSDFAMEPRLASGSESCPHASANSNLSGESEGAVAGFPRDIGRCVDFPHRCHPSEETGCRRVRPATLSTRLRQLQPTGSVAGQISPAAFPFRPVPLRSWRWRCWCTRANTQSSTAAKSFLWFDNAYLSSRLNRALPAVSRDAVRATFSDSWVIARECAQRATSLANALASTTAGGCSAPYSQLPCNTISVHYCTTNTGTLPSTRTSDV